MTGARLARRLRTLAWVALGTAALAVAYAPAWSAPLFSDDLQLSHEAYPQFDGSYATALTESWVTGWQPNRFSPVGRFFSYTFHFAMHDLAVRSGLSMELWYRGAGLAMLVALSAAAALTLVAAARFVARANGWLRCSRAYAAVSIAIAVLIQLHPWSTDGLLSIFDVGLGAGVLSLLVVAAGLWAVGSQRPLWLVASVVGVVAVCGVLFYETIAAAVAATAIAYGWAFVSERRAARPGRRPLMLGLVGVVIPALVFVAGRIYVSTLDLAEYAGTDVALRPEGVAVLARLTGATVPGYGLRELMAMTGGLRVTSLVLVCAFALIMIVAAALILARRRRALTVNRRAWVIVAMLGTLVLLTYAMHSFTEKYIREIVFPGRVYISYVTGVAVVAIVLAALALSVRPRVAERWGMVVLPALGAWVVVQQAANWSAVETFASQSEAVSALSAAVVEWNPDEAARCVVMERWVETSGEDPRLVHRVVTGANDAYTLDFGEPFCDEVRLPASL
ncbi:hypothetical protein [Demequina sp. NBRC 110053]|uniref:hypothetical protein n=1 Tax=Demequina sp. NBRC 110053 TaxID=1570342 RepID=UPI001184AAE8|nr:hypothetical protein [Demequina sp. NBRC 110053]